MSESTRKPATALITAKKGQVSLVAFVAAFVLPGVFAGVLAFVYISVKSGVVQRTAEVTNEEYLPSFMERQRTLLNIEKLRRYVEIIYAAESQTVRRTSNINALALASESVFQPQSGLNEYAPLVTSQIRALTEARNRVQESLERLREYELRFRDAVTGLSAIAGMPKIPIYPHGASYGSTPRERRVYALYRQQTEEALEPFYALCSGREPDAELESSLVQSCTQISRYWEALDAEWHARTDAELESRDLWRKLDDLLRQLTDTAYTAESVLTYKALGSVVRDASHIRWVAVLSAVFVTSGFLLFVAMAYIYLAKPLAMVARNLTEIRNGRDFGEPPKVRIKEFQNVIMQLPYLKQHLEDLNARSGQLAEEKSMYESLSFVDGLTGIGNRRSFDQQLASENPQSALSLLFLDVDLFKKYNDTLGHQAGDVALIAVARAMKQALLRSTDRAFRYGGEEFAVILSDATEESAMAVAARILITIRGLNIPHPASSVAPILTVSIGVSTRNPGEDIPDRELVERADKALYRAKSSGRNRICVFQHGDMFRNKDLPVSDEIKILQ